MRKCPECGKTYDDSWKICLTCSVDLSEDLSIMESNPELRKEGSNKSLKGVTAFGLLIIIGSVLSLLGYKENLKINHIVSNYIYLIILPSSIISAVFLLKLKNWARVALIVISVITLAEGLISTPYVLNKYQNEYDMSGFKKSFYEGFESAKKNKKPGATELNQQQIEALEQKAMVAIKKGMIITLIIAIILSVIFNCLLIYYLALPRVRERFR